MGSTPMSRTMARHACGVAVLLPILLDSVRSLAFTGSIRSLPVEQSRRICSSRSSTAATTRLHMTVEPIFTLLLAPDGASSLSDFADQAPDVLGAASDLAGSAADLAGSAADLAGSAKSSLGESLGSIGSVWDSVVDSFTSAKDQAADTTLGSVDALKAQVGELGANALSPFQRLGEDLSNSITGGLDSLKSGAQGAVEGAQTQLGETVTDSIGNPLQEGLGQVFSKFGTSPEELVKQEESWTSGVGETIKGVEKVATPSTLFYAENAAILPLWAGMIVWPEEKITKAVMSTYAPVVVAALIYVWLTYECFQNPVSLQGFASGITNLNGLTQGFGEEVSVAAAWSHFLAEDLFIGRWVYLDGQKNGIFTKHSLALCYLFGPVGFLSHLVTRTAFSVVKPGVKDIMEVNVAQPKASPAASPATSPNSNKVKEVLAEARREAEAIVGEARSAGAAQAASLLEAAETEALDILKGAEVERSAMLKANKTEAATAVQTDPAAAGAAGQAASVVKEPPAPVVANNPVPVVAKTEASANSPDAASPS